MYIFQFSVNIYDLDPPEDQDDYDDTYIQLSRFNKNELDILESYGLKLIQEAFQTLAEFNDQPERQKLADYIDLASYTVNHNEDTILFNFKVPCDNVCVEAINAMADSEKEGIFDSPIDGPLSGNNKYMGICLSAKIVEHA